MPLSATRQDALEGLPITVSQFTTAFPAGPAFGTMARTTWGAFAEMFQQRRQGDKDGPCFATATFKTEPGGQVRRLKENALTRTAVALDCETNKMTGEVPPPLSEAVERIEGMGWAGVVYTSHSHTHRAPRYRIVLPLSGEIAADLPAVDVIADQLGVLGVLDLSKLGAASIFYHPSADPGCLVHHETVVLDGAPIDCAWIQEQAGALLEAREGERERQRAEALEAATKRRDERIRQGQDPNTSVIESVRHHLDLASELIRHGYHPAGDKRFLYPGSETGVAGVYLLTGRDGVERVYSHHAADPLAAGNLPSWCRAKALDAVDVVTILDHGSDLKAALRTLAKRFRIETPRTETPRHEPPPHPGYDGPDDRDVTDPSTPATAKPAPAGFSPIDPTTWHGVAVPEREWIVQDWLPVGHVTLLYGDGGVGKTLLAQQLMTSCATGSPWCGLAVQKCRVFGMFCEDDADELHRRQAAILDGRNRILHRSGRHAAGVLRRTG